MRMTYERAKEKLSYDPETGEFTRIRLNGKNIKTGKKQHDGYIYVSVDATFYCAHRVAFLLMTGRWPHPFVDHINGIRDDNRWSNLRESSRAMNAQNILRPSRRNSSGFLGVSHMKGRWRATLSIAGKQVWLGLYDTPEQAHQAYLDGKRRLHEGCTI